MSVHFDAITLPELSARERALETASPPETTQFSLVGTASAQINEGALLAFDSALPKQMIDDISNSLLFAQLAADKQFNRHTATGDWQRTFFGTLSVMGWITGSLSERTEVAASPVDWAELITSYMPENVINSCSPASRQLNSCPPQAVQSAYGAMQPWLVTKGSSLSGRVTFLATTQIWQSHF